MSSELEKPGCLTDSGKIEASKASNQSANLEKQIKSGKNESSVLLDQDSITLKLSKTLIKQLISKSKSEGVSPEDLACELLSEGLVLRAWEIIEKKHAMQSGGGNSRGSNNHNGQPYSAGPRNANGGRGYRQHNSRRGGGNFEQNRKANYRGVVDDRANFLEYVRSQEVKDYRR